ncbi:MAG: hypothetical protein PHR35_18040, partial [Kiritimatiellae bacterium]|nr:hypothetical protein [Kiritimatiellia bacterium]
MGILRKPSHLAQGLPSLDLVEQALYVLRHAPPLAIGAFWFGGVPYALGLIYFWSDMSRGAMAASRLTAGALLLACAHLWMRVWQARGCAVLSAAMRDAPAPAWRLRDGLAEAGLQLRWGAWTWVSLPFAMLATLPYARVYAFYQSLVAADEVPSGRVAAANRLAVLWPWQNHLLVFWLLIFRAIVFVEVVTCLRVLPWLAHAFLGVDSPGMRYALWFLNTTVLCLALAMTHLLLDPLVKAIYVLRCFYGGATATGVDLLTEWRAERARRRSNRGGSVVAVCLALALLLTPAAAPAAATTPAESSTVTPAHLDEALSVVMARPVFAWRMPRETVRQSGKDNWLLRQLRALGVRLRRLGAALADLWERFCFWLMRHFRPRYRPVREPGAITAVALKWTIAVLLGLLLAAIGWIVWRGRRRVVVATA